MPPGDPAFEGGTAARPVSPSSHLTFVRGCCGGARSLHLRCLLCFLRIGCIRPTKRGATSTVCGLRGSELVSGGAGAGPPERLGATRLRRKARRRFLSSALVRGSPYALLDLPPPLLRVARYFRPGAGLRGALRLCLASWALGGEPLWCPSSRPWALGRLGP